MPPSDETPPRSSAETARERPWSQEFLTRRLAFPAYCATKSFAAATRDFTAEAARIERACAAFSTENFSRRAELPDRFDGDPGSGAWSAAMVVEHLIAAGETIARIAEMLAREQTVPWTFAVDALRPRGDRGLAVMQDFRNFTAHYVQLAEEDLALATSRRTHDHPLHGPLDLHRWHCFSAVHLRRHRRQLVAIRQGLDDAARSGRETAVLLEPSPGLHPSP